MTRPAAVRYSATTVVLMVAVVLTAPTPVRPLDGVTPATSLVNADPSGPQTATKVSPGVRERVTNTLAQLPLAFEPNQGQFHPEVKFLTRAPGYLLQLTATEMRMIVKGAATPPTRGTPPSVELSTGASLRPAHALTLTWLGADRHALATPEAALPGVVSYLKGSDPAKWHTAIPTFAQVRYEGIYPGIDVVYYGNGNQLEYDLVVAPHADPNVARLALDGAEATLTENGDLDLALSHGRVVQLRAPVAYQEREGQRRPVAVRYRLTTARGNTEVSFQLDEYDAGLPVVIDPLIYSTFLERRTV